MSKNRRKNHRIPYGGSWILCWESESGTVK